MLNKRNLDDQSYRSIVEAAMGRLPWICPTWTDHNSHDPGVTILELMAWYKEMQQYQMNQVTDEMRDKLLKIAGVYRKPAAPATCALLVEDDTQQRLPRSRLATPEGILFELDEALPALRPKIASIQVDGVELLTMLQTGKLTFQPFAFGQKQNTCLRLGLEHAETEALHLWFQVVAPEGVQRNPFLRADQMPRKLRWSVDGLGEVFPVQDDTHALSQSGFLHFAGQQDWPQTEGLSWLQVELVDGGCEEDVRLSGVTASRRTITQRETRAKSYTFTAPENTAWNAILNDAMARDAVPVVFVRRQGGWQQQQNFSVRQTIEGLGLTLDTQGLDQDGQDNVTVVCLDAFRWREMLFDAKGLPNEMFQLNLEGRKVLTETFTLWCNTLDRDGVIRLRPWTCVSDLSLCGPRDRVFQYDALRETILFGDGEHGALLRGGTGAVLIADMELSVCAGGNIPAQASLRFVDDGTVVIHTDAMGGRDRETAEQAAARFLMELKNTVKCVSAEDYEMLALTTPGLRVGAVKAIPGYDMWEPSGQAQTPVVTLVAVPASGGRMPMPDQNFLQEIRHRMERLRPVCTRIHVVEPVYQEMDVTVRFGIGDPITEDLVRRETERYLSAQQVGIGGTISANELAARLQALPGARRIINVDIRPAQPGCYQNTAGEIQLPRRGIASLRNLTVTRQGQR